MAKIFDSSGKLLCGGTLIHRRYVLTAAQCIDGRTNLFVTLGNGKILNPNETDRHVNRTIIHRDYNKTNLANDIGILVLDREVHFNVDIQPICILLGTYYVGPNAMRGLYAIGRQETSISRESVDPLFVPLLDHNPRTCSRDSPLSEGQVCAVSRLNKTCELYTGGPVARKINYYWPWANAQFGIISSGFSNCNATGLFTDLFNYTQWIVDNVVDLS
ncbi:serine protease grass-like [Drosophila rhopaloa]|uniref:Peptidase S1 domain-containing protein n=1 Tax=Drosophila rhopaloa TaxID=1041015 RepID=A0ABM5H6S1_DRORH|nr:serine protease grass-like [Drosophila rhopaloa]